MCKCKYCNREFSKKSGLGVHEIQCKLNPNRRNIQQGRVAWNKGLTIDDPRVARYIEKQRGKPKVMSEQGKANIKLGAVNNGGYRENAGRSKKFRVFDSFGTETTLQSTFELRCSKILNELTIKWLRPKALKYDGRNYFADFYLPEYDIWLDPKNDYKAKQDEEKIKKVIEQNGVKLFVLLDHQLTSEYIASLVK